MTRTICSITYRYLKARRPYRYRDTEGGFGTHFEMLPAARDGYSLLTIRDMEEDFKFSSESPRTVMHKETTGDKVASCLITEWIGNLAVGGIMGDSVPGKPGIFICTELDKKDSNGRVTEPATGPGPTELRVARESQAIWCESLCLEASEFARTGQGRKIKMEVHSAAAEWLGKKFGWQNAPAQTFTAECPVCGTEIKPGKFKCIGCGEVIDPVGFEAWKKEAADLAEARTRLARQPDAAGELIGAGTGKPKSPAMK